MTSSLQWAPERTAPADATERAFRAMGCDVRLVVWPRAGCSPSTVAEQVSAAERLIHACDASLTRFEPTSELAQLNANPAATVAVSRLLARAVTAALGAAERSRGLVDPTLLAPLTEAGYATDWDAARRLPLAALLAAAPSRRAARGITDGAWQSVSVDLAHAVITRPPGVHFDLGATAKGLIADLALRLLAPLGQAFVDAGGDIAISGGELSVLADDPFGRAPTALTVAGPAGLATSSIAGRCWTTPTGPAHHLIDPALGRPAFTGVVQATAAAPTAAEAERLAGEALLSGPDAGAAVLCAHGGILILDTGDIRQIPGDQLR